MDRCRLRAARRTADLAGLVGLKPHEFRCFVGSQLAAGDIRKARKALGHKRIDTTGRHHILDELEPGLTDDLLPSSIFRQRTHGKTDSASMASLLPPILPPPADYGL
jgi:hypothetical protein